MGGDVCHHGAELRPSSHASIPSDIQIPFSTPQVPSLCLGAAHFHALNKSRGNGPNEPFFLPAPENTHDMQMALGSIGHTQGLDGQDDVWVVFAHDMSIEGVADFFPKGANDWKEKGWKAGTAWRFLEDLGPAAAKIAQDVEQKEASSK